MTTFPCPAPPIQGVLSRLPDAKQNGSGWKACCPAHDDRNPSLSIGEADDGRVLLKCFAGCSVEDICSAMDLSMRDLRPDDGVDADTIQKRTGKTAIVSTSTSNDGGKRTFSTANDAIAELERKQGKRSESWTYHNIDGEPIGVIIRWDTATGKDIRPVSRNGAGWVIAGMSSPRPLYRLPELMGSKRVYLCEGEKAADAARSIGLTATTSPHGSKSALKADWSPLAGKEVIILPDHDSADRKYADDVTGILATLKPPSIVKAVELPNLPESGDIVDWLESHDAHDSAEQCQSIEKMADLVGTVTQLPSCPPMMPWVPFPTEALPEPVQSFVVEAATAIGCDPSFVALPLLSALASAIGNSRRIELKRGWTEPAIIWTAIVGDSGTQKSPALETALRPIRTRQREAFKEHEEKGAEYQQEQLCYDRDLSQWKRSKSNSDEPPTKPDEPVAERYFCDDVTVEGIALLLQNQPRGLLMTRDELAGWLASFDRYAGGKGGDVAKWLEAFGGRSWVVDRKTSGTIHVPRAAVSITGGIQPETLRRSLGQQHRENGLAARILLAMPPSKPKQWTEAELNPEIENRISELFDCLYGLEPVVSDSGEQEPAIINLSSDGKQAWIRFYDQHADQQAELTGDLSAVWSKIEGYAARLALVIHLVRYAAGDSTLQTADDIDAESINRAVMLAKWFAHEAKRVYAVLDESETDREQRKLIELINRKGGRITVRELMRSSRQFALANDAESALDELAKAGHGAWKTNDNDGPGRPTNRFVLTC